MNTTIPDLMDIKERLRLLTVDLARYSESRDNEPDLTQAAAALDVAALHLMVHGMSSNPRINAAEISSAMRNYARDRAAAMASLSD